MEAVSSAPWPELIGILVCLVTSAFFSGSETVLTRMSETRVQHLIDSEPSRFGILSFWTENRRRILAALLVGNNVVNILASILTYRVALYFLDSYVEAVSVFGLTLVILIFAEITPKSLALSAPDYAAVPVLRVVWLLDKLFWVVSMPLSRIPALITGSHDSGAQGPQITEDEIEYQIRLGHDRAVFEEKAQGDLLISAVEFSDVTVKEVMVPRTNIFGLEVETPVAESIDAVIRSGHSRLPIYEDNLDNIVGVLHAKDLLNLPLNQPGEQLPSNIQGIVRTPPFFVPETQKAPDLLARMRRLGLHMAIVVDEFGGTAGLVTLEDIIEELVGEIRDEFDTEEVKVRRVLPRTWVVDARLSLHDLRDATGIELPDTGEYESVGGFVIWRCGLIPEKGTVVTIPGLRVTVLAANPRNVEKLELEVLSEEPPSDE